MASGITTAFWGMTINNYDETDLAMVQNGYPDYLREIVHTLEKGEEGTPHIQAWIKLQRQQRLSFVKKLFPRGHFKPLTSDQYIANTKKYAQKLDDTAVAGAVHRFNDPLHTIESVIRKVVGRMLYGDPTEHVVDHTRYSQLQRKRIEVEYEMVSEDFRYAKIFVSATYKQMWKQFGTFMFESIWKQMEDTHTHTHSAEKFSRDGGINSDAERDDETGGQDTEESSEGEGSEGEDHEDGESEADEGYTESECDGSGEEDDWEGSGEQDALSAH